MIKICNYKDTSRKPPHRVQKDPLMHLRVHTEGKSNTFTDMNDMDMAPPCVMFPMQIIDIRSGNTVNHYPGDSFADKPSNPLKKNCSFERLFERNGAIRSGSLQRAIIPITSPSSFY